MDKKKKKNSGNWNNQKKNQQNIENNNASNRSKEFRFDNSSYQNPDYEKQKVSDKAIETAKWLTDINVAKMYIEDVIRLSK